MIPACPSPDQILQKTGYVFTDSIPEHQHSPPQVSSTAASQDDPEEIIERTRPLARRPDFAQQSDGRFKQFFTGESQLVARPGMGIESPIQHGIVSDWDAVERVWDHAFRRHLSIDLTTSPLLMVEPNHTGSEWRTKSTTLAFEAFELPAFFVGRAATLAAFSTARHSALVVDLGAGATTVTAVVEGNIMYQSLLASKVGGEQLDLLLERMSFTQPLRAGTPPTQAPLSPLLRPTPPLSIAELTPSYLRFSQLEMLRQIKEEMCETSDTAFSIEPSVVKAEESFELPDKKKLVLSLERFAVPECFVSGAALQPASDLMPDYTFNGLSNMIARSIDLCDIDLRRDLCNNIIVVGGGSQMRGLHNRLFNSLPGLLAPVRPPPRPTTLISHLQALKPKVTPVTTPQERHFASWIGGSVMASLGSFHQMWISKSEFQEYGSSIVLRKCPT